MKHLSRNDRSTLGRWFWTIDKPLLTLVLLLIGLGVIAVAAASPVAARRYSGGNFHVDDLFYLKRQIMWVLAGVPLMLAVSMLPMTWAKRVAIGGTIGFLVMLFAVPFVGSEVNGAVRWINLPGFQLQPSEFLKPLFIVTTAWLLAARFDDRTLPTMQLSFGLLVVISALLIKQPDFGQTALFAAVWAAQAILAGMSVMVIGGLACFAVAGMGVAYLTSTHVAERIDHFVKGTGDTYQIDRALDCFKAGGLFGAGPGEGQMKFRLPEAQTDYIFSVIGEEFGAIACFMLAVLYLAIVVRVLLQLLDEEEPFVFLAAAGLAIQFGLQAAINMAVNLALLPSKGMTLPFVSHGGSSFLALSIGMGLLLALTRRNPYLKASPYAAAARAA
ncbi:putative lipid II flippase FtsW [Polymorphobacter sp. PAMC 29334]|uniref:FtsW/RodA/SpoVE family cell cycle protein n=1 Tax=Polymorphobacter sp. PAMC 29334 TaxID=2862331 RepID=UPI001C67E972|nr:putative peptidoglycan glycosyltransferase FtsW [Polymorphobacter sp. PAMC 29334]QYE35091.1 putative lipid II flippase FtsW [Polymorphobacter sp. PAMC 29334]